MPSSSGTVTVSQPRAYQTTMATSIQQQRHPSVTTAVQQRPIVHRPPPQALARPAMRQPIRHTTTTTIQRQPAQSTLHGSGTTSPAPTSTQGICSLFMCMYFKKKCNQVFKTVNVLSTSLKPEFSAWHNTKCSSVRNKLFNYIIY